MTRGVIEGLEYHPISEIFPLIEGEAFEKFVSDIKEKGLLEPIVLYEGKILDGRNRLRGCAAAGIEPRYEEFKGTPEEAIDRVWSLNRQRRHLNPSQIACCDALKNKLLDSYRAVREAAKGKQAATYPAKGQKGFQPNVPELIPTHKVEETKAVETRKVRAEAAGTNPRYIDMADQLLEEDPEAFKQVQRGEKRLTTVHREHHPHLAQVRRGTKPKPKTKTKRKPVKRATIRGEVANRRMIERVIKCARENKPLSYARIAQITGVARSFIDEFVTNSQLIPWVHVEASVPEKVRTKLDQYDRDAMYQFFINEDLKAVCDNWQVQPRLGASVLSMVVGLRKEINRRLEEIQERANRTKWNPDTVAKGALINVIEFVREQLDLIVNPNMTTEDLILDHRQYHKHKEVNHGD